MSKPEYGRFYLTFEEHATRRLTRLYAVKQGHFIVDTIDAEGDSEIVEIDFSTWDLGARWSINQQDVQKGVHTDLSLPDWLRHLSYGLSYDETHHDFLVRLNWYHAAGSMPDRPNTITSFPAYPIWDDTPQVPLVPTVTYSEETLTYPQKQAAALLALERWRAQKRAWLLELEQRSDLHPELVKHGGYWLRAGDAALQIEFQDPDVDPIVVAQMARCATKGAADIDTADEFAEDLETYISQFPNGPDRPVLWVTKGEGDGSLGEVAQVDLADSHQYPAGTLADDYNPIATDWQVANQPGEVVIDDYQPSAGDTITASVADPDGVVGTPTLQWQSAPATGAFTDVAGATAAAYVVPIGTAVGTRYRCLASYTDNYGPNQSAASETAVVE